MQKTVFAAAVSAAALLAQQPQVHVIEDKIHAVGAPAMATNHVTGGSAFSWVGAEMSFEAAIVKGVPFTGDFVTENSQTLADGNRIKNSNTTSYARDGEGRTRREITIGAIGPFTDGVARKTIFIHDPVGKIDYILDPQAKTARKISVGVAMTKIISGTPGKEVRSGQFSRRVETVREEGAKEAATFVFQSTEEGAKATTVTGEPAGAVSFARVPFPDGGPVPTAGVLAAPRAEVAFSATVSDNVKTDTLGKRIIEGVEAEGTRTVITIPAGQIGNDLPLETVSERWYSGELKTVVMTNRKDPRMGESTYKLTNLRRGEPSRNLFEVPSDYKILEDGPGNVMRLRVDRKQE